MAGVKGRSGGNGRKTVEEHLANGTYRKDRHGPLIQAEQTPKKKPLHLLALNEEEKTALSYLRLIIPAPQPSMAIHLSILAHDLALYIKAHRDVVENGMYAEDWKGNRVLSPAFRVRERLLKQVRTDLVGFSLSTYQQAQLIDKITTVQSRIGKPKLGKPLE